LLVSKLGAAAAEVLRDGCAFVEARRQGVRVRFGRHAFDEASRELRIDKRLVPLSPKAFDLLAVLIRERPRALAKAELRDRLWPDTFVGETSLPRVVGEIRRALGERPNGPSCVRTVQRFGYAFVGAAIDDAGGAGSERAAGLPQAGCALLWGERLVPLAAGENFIGRGPECALTIPSGLVSRQHARIVVDGERVTLRDLGSKNGTRLAGRRVEGEVSLTDGDELKIGPALLVFCAPGGGSTRTLR
jgi:DNA-binding winged helix-turn-helix (wHTH) protein